MLLFLVLVGSPVFAATPLAVDHHVSAMSDATLRTQSVVHLVDSNRQHAARVVAEIRRPLFFAWAFAQVAAFAWLWRSGMAARIRNWLRRRTRSISVQRALFGATLAITGALAGLPFSFASYRVLFNVGLTEQRIGAWFADFAIGTMVGMLIVAIVVTLVLALVDRTHLWYIAVFFGLFALASLGAMLRPVVLDPFFGPERAVQTRTLRARIDAIEAAAKTSIPIVVTQTALRRTIDEPAVEGLGPTTRILLPDSLLAVATDDEIAFFLAQSIAEAPDAFRRTCVATFLLALAAALAVLMSDRIGFRRDDDPLVRLSLVAAFLGVFCLALYPVYNAYSRTVTARADAAALILTHDPGAGIRGFVRIVDDGEQQLCLPRTTRLYFAARPSYGTRIANLQHAANPCR